ncbi:MAG TPA: ATP-dependent helicase [Terriglobia bacterium]|nr:ATP-dependent helicase [Terriglobia bacterium]
MIPSPYQQAIYDFIKNEKGSCVVEAVAGSGKTTTIVEAAKLLPENLFVAFVAFNKAIAKELSTRLPPLVKSCTLNSLGFTAWLKSAGRHVQVDAHKISEICDDVIESNEKGSYAQAVKKLVGLAKAHGLVPKEWAKGRIVLTHDTEQNWYELADKYAVEPDGGGTMEKLVEYSRIVLRQSIKLANQVIDFDDQIYMPVICQCNFFRYDVLFVDELQDVSMIQRAMLRLSIKKTGRLIGVGDKKQSLYGFRGAGIDSIDRVVEEFNAKVLPLSISYRCPQSVVKEARRYVEHIEPHESAPVGKVETLMTYHPGIFRNSDGIVCRNSAPLVDLAYRLIRFGRGCRILGREIGQGLIRLIEKLDAFTIDELESNLQVYAAREIGKCIAKGQEDKAAGIADKVETIRVIIEDLPEKKRTIEYLCESIGSLFTDKDEGLLTLSTVHKAKGLEYDRVFILEPQLMPSPWARQAWQKDQEQNIAYVAVTRSKSELYYITVNGLTEETPQKTVAVSEAEKQPEVAK